MKALTLQVGGKVRIVFQDTAINFIRNVNATRYTDVNYSNGTGVPAQQLTAGQVLYSEGTVGQIGYIRILSTNTVTLNSTGIFNITIQHYPSSTQVNQSKTFVIDGSTGTVLFTYNSAPITDDIVVTTPNRTTYVFQTTDFTSKITDPDGDGIDAIQLVGSLVGFLLNGSPIATDTWVPMADIIAGHLTYVPTDQDAAYSITINYRARDINGNISQE